jgi:hypothetical protein
LTAAQAVVETAHGDPAAAVGERADRIQRERRQVTVAAGGSLPEGQRDEPGERMRGLVGQVTCAEGVLDEPAEHGGVPGPQHPRRHSRKRPQCPLPHRVLFVAESGQ